MPTELDQTVGETIGTLIVSLAGCVLAVPALALAGFSILAILG